MLGLLFPLWQRIVLRIVIYLLNKILLLKDASLWAFSTDTVFRGQYKVRKWSVVLSLHSFALMISLVAQEL